MRFRAWRYVAIAFAFLFSVWIDNAAGAAAVDPVAAIRTLPTAPDGEYDFARAKLLIDRVAGQEVDEDRVLREIDRMVAIINKMLATIPKTEASTSLGKLRALSAFLSHPGWWNDKKPFQYDPVDPLGKNPANALLARYLTTRRGNCVSMPILFVILGERLGLRMTLSSAPLHVFVKWTNAEDGKTYNLEATSGGGFARDVYYRQSFTMSDEAVSNGVYLKTLTRREAYALMTSTAIAHLNATGRYEEAIAIADLALEAYPADAVALVNKGAAFAHIIDRDIFNIYPDPIHLPPKVLGYANRLGRANHDAYTRAEALGWRETDGIRQPASQ